MVLQEVFRYYVHHIYISDMNIKLKILQPIFPIFLLVVLCVSCKSQANLGRISQDIYNCQKVRFPENEEVIKSLDIYRQKFNWIDKLNYSSEEDTLFVLEMPGIQGNYMYTIWNKTDTISYTNESGNFMLSNRPLFTEYMMKLVGEWNIQEIKEEEKNSSLYPTESIFASKIIIKNKKYKIVCVKFKDFFNLKRDGMDFRD